jgi:ribosome biogenesis GTPase
MPSGTIIAAHGRQFFVEEDSGQAWRCIIRGRRGDWLCGDRVDFVPDGVDTGIITERQPRRSVFFRRDAFNLKAIAANLDQLLVVVAALPPFSAELTQRCLLAAEDQGIRGGILLNKSDLPETPLAREQLSLLAQIGYPVIEVSALAGASPLLPHLTGHRTLLAGESGMGKSTLINALIHDAAAQTGTWSRALETGRHTTSSTRLYHIDAHSSLIDSPGVQEFALLQLSDTQLALAFVEFRPWLGQCRFRNCIHDQEPGCALRAAVDAGHIDPGRFKLFHRIRRENQFAHTALR